jgi:predicted Ser/Thr protein kinase
VGDAELLRWLRAGEHASDALISSGYQGAAYLYEGSQGRRVIKAATGSGIVGWVRRRMIRREFAMYQRLASVDGVPHCHGLLDGQYLVLDFVDGVPLSDVDSDITDRDTFYKGLLKIILNVHLAGVAHADMKRRGNVLVSPDQRPCMLDFGTAVAKNDGGGWFNRWLFKQARQFDYNAWIKLKYRRDYDSITPEDQPYYRPTPVENLARLIRRGWRTVTFRQYRKARRRARESGSG